MLKQLVIVLVECTVVSTEHIAREVKYLQSISKNTIFDNSIKNIRFLEKSFMGCQEKNLWSPMKIGDLI